MDVQAFRERLMKQYDYNPTSGSFIHKRKAYEGRVAGSVNNSGYVAIRFEGSKYLAHRLAFLITYGVFPKQQVDHIDNCRTNNAIKNLREASKLENSRNMSKKSSNTSGFIGVTLHKNGKWRARVCDGEKRVHVGLYETAKEAAIARDMVALEVHGEFAKLNFKYNCVDGTMELAIVGD